MFSLGGAKCSAAAVGLLAHLHPRLGTHIVTSVNEQQPQWLGGGSGYSLPAIPHFTHPPSPSPPPSPLTLILSTLTSLHYIP